MTQSIIKSIKLHTVTLQYVTMPATYVSIYQNELIYQYIYYQQSYQ